MMLKVKAFTERLNEDEAGRLDALAERVNKCFDGAEVTIKKIEPITFETHGTYMALIVTYEENNTSSEAANVQPEA